MIGNVGISIFFSIIFKVHPCKISLKSNEISSLQKFFRHPRRQAIYSKFMKNHNKSLFPLMHFAQQFQLNKIWHPDGKSKNETFFWYFLNICHSLWTNWCSMKLNIFFIKKLCTSVTNNQIWIKYWVSIANKK